MRLKRFKSVLVFFYLMISFSAKGNQAQLYISPNYLSQDLSRLNDLFDVDKIPFSGLDSLLKRKDQGIHFLQYQDSWVAWQECGFDLLLLEDGVWKNLYQFNNYGYTCGSTIFVRDGKIYLLGGQGIFNYHADLIEFFTQFGSWEIVSVAQQPLSYHTSWIGKSEEGIFHLRGQFFSKRENLERNEPEGFYQDLKENKWKKLRIEWDALNNIPESEGEDSLVFDLRDFSISYHLKGWYVLDKKKAQLYLLSSDLIPISIRPDFHKISGNLLQWGIVEKGVQEIDLEKLIIQGRKVADLRIVPRAEEISPKVRNHNLFIILVFIGLFGTLAYLFLRKKVFIQNQPSEVKMSDKQVPLDDLDPTQKIWVKLKENGNTSYTTDELDQIFELDKITNIDNKRVKRSRIIKSLNDVSSKQCGKLLITRERQPDDRRYFRFRVEFPEPKEK